MEFLSDFIIYETPISIAVSYKYQEIVELLSHSNQNWTSDSLIFNTKVLILDDY